MKVIFFLISFALLNIGSFAMEFKTGFIDTVYSFKPGTGQNSGQEVEFYPMNIFGPPDFLARDNFQSADPAQILSIGLGGEITVGFKNFRVIDGPGPDFTVFENAFFNPVTNKIFAEPAKISVSQDGIKFYDFKFDSLTLAGCAGTIPTHGDQNPFDTSHSGGNKFDLAELGLNWIKFIKISDICQMLLDHPENEYYDPIISGFDLDAIAGLHLLENEQTNIKMISDEFFRLNENRNEIRIYSDKLFLVEFYDSFGNLKYRSEYINESTINKSDWINGLYLLKISTKTESKLLKVIILN